MNFCLADLERIINEIKLPIKPFLCEGVSCGAVFRADLKQGLLSRLELVVGESGISSLPVYFDADQKPDCIIFEDREIMSAYLNRKENPLPWFKICMGLRPEMDVSLESLAFEPIPPRIPNYSNFHFWHYDPSNGLG